VVTFSRFVVQNATGELTRLDLSGNSIGGSITGVKAIAKALKTNESITDINLASNNFNAECAQILAPAIEAMVTTGVLAKLTIIECALPIQELKTATELDLSGKGFTVEDAIIVASCIQVRITLVLHGFHSDVLISCCRPTGHWHF
jgi:Ran GTPase-activating protein (RanGAP) involved in mRNA processing and transport